MSQQVVPEIEPMIDATEAAQILGLHPVTVRELAASHKIPGIKIGKLWRFRASSLDAWIRYGLESSAR